MYQPILKGKKGELDAWGKVSGKRRNHIVPLFEIVAESGTDTDLEKFHSYLAGAVVPGDLIAVDAIQLDAAMQAGVERAIYTWLRTALDEKGAKFRPVIHFDDNKARIDDALTAAQDGIVLRLVGANGAPPLELQNQTLADWCQAYGVETASVHLLIDLGSIYGADPASKENWAGSYLRWANANGPWASVTLASGAFPPQITTVPKARPFPFPRGDAELWNLAKKHSKVPNLHFGDYGVRHPALPTNGFGGPLPNLRYTSDTEWIVWRESKDQKFPNGSFFRVCAGIAGHNSFKGPEFSWADNVIHEKSRLQPGDPGPGTGTEWITYGMNHHFEMVVDRLTNGGDA